MSDQNIKIRRLKNGMTLVIESMAEVSSATFVFLLPAGAAHDPQNLTGTAAVLSELLFRGAGEMDNRTLNDQLDGLGLQRQSTVSSLHSGFTGALIGDNLIKTLKLYAGPPASKLPHSPKVW